MGIRLLRLLMAIAVAVPAVLAISAVPSYAAFHLMNIRQVWIGTVDTPGDAQFVELQMRAANQNVVANHELFVFDAAGTLTDTFVFPSNVSNGSDQGYILIATAQAESLFDITADLVITPSLVPTGGKVCFETAVDCFAWGDYTGSPTGVGNPFRPASGLPVGGGAALRDISAGNPSLLEPGDDTNDSAADFDLAASPVPHNNAGDVGSLPSATAPAAPTVTSSTPSSGAISVAFTPGSSGGSAITGFTAQCLSTDGGVARTKSGTSSPLNVTLLSGGKNYHCRVRATNAVGTSPYSAFGATVPVGATAPAAPTVTSSTPSSGAISVAFTPGSSGGSAITGFTAQCLSTDGGVARSKTGPTSPLIVTSLSGGKNYHCRVRATNAVGVSPFSAFGATVMVGATAPAAPTVTSSTPSSGAISVAFTPGSTGGSAITGFTAQCLSTDGGVARTTSGTSSPLNVTLLSGGKNYHCRVRATNAVGTGPFSAFGATVPVP
ncbi:fibronectin type III domain-containing protein [Nocardioides stalactiti]|uniref:fibronectin type III domain-containing protein n=1 Tax=Nocardioides stalactiti TaxID=2755356 RepID=UPI0015FF7D73|nr:fibronectin type III domain-containing protein [Nocardioides stalactiti]